MVVVVREASDVRLIELGLSGIENRDRRLLVSRLVWRVIGRADVERAGEDRRPKARSARCSLSLCWQLAIVERPPRPLGPGWGLGLVAGTFPGASSGV